MKSGQYLFTESDIFPDRFVVRFKHQGPVTMAEFKKELIANHSMEEYFGALENEDYSQRKAPLEILKAKNPSWYEGIKVAWMSKH